MDGWIPKARAQLLRLRRGEGWGYRRGGARCVEPTVLACLALEATGPGDPVAAALIRRSAAWLAGLQDRNGAVGVSDAVRSPEWPTAFALLLWSALGGDEPRRARAVAWLLHRKGTTAAARDPILGHDPTIPGWPWVAGTHSWVEPTAAAVLALRREGLTAHPRVGDGLRLLRDRAIATGGWNCGNNAVFGRQLRPLPAPTGLALLALRGDDPASPPVARGIAYLRDELARTRSAVALGWGLMGLAAWGAAPAEAASWLAESFDRSGVGGGPSSPMGLALLLLAGSPGARLLSAPGEPWPSSPGRASPASAAPTLQGPQNTSPRWKGETHATR